MQLFPISAVQFLDKIHREMTVIHIDLNKHNIFEADIREVFDRYKIDLGFFNSISFCPHLIAFKADGEMFTNNINEGFFKSISQTSSIIEVDSIEEFADNYRAMKSNQPFQTSLF